MSESYSLYASRDSGLHALNPLTKLVGTLFFIVCGIALPGLWTAYLVFAIAILPLAAWGNVLRPLLSVLWKLVLPFAISVFLIQGFFWTGGTPLFTIGPLSFKEEGLFFAIASTGRILALISGFLLFALVTRPDDLMIGLAQRGVPNSLTYIILSALQIVPSFRRKADTILDAQRSRGLETTGGYRQRMRALLPLVEPLILGSIIDIDERAIALEARAFSRKGAKTFLRIVADSQWQRALRWLLILATVLILIARLTSVWWGDLL